MPEDKLMRDSIVWELEMRGLQKLLNEAYEEQNQLYLKHYKAKLMEMYGDDKHAWLKAMTLAIIDEYGEYQRMEDEWEKKYELVDILHFILQMFIFCKTDIYELPLVEIQDEGITLEWLVKKWVEGAFDDRTYVELVWIWFLSLAGDLLSILARYHFKAVENARRQKEGY